MTPEPKSAEEALSQFFQEGRAALAEFEGLCAELAATPPAEVTLQAARALVLRAHTMAKHLTAAKAMLATRRATYINRLFDENAPICIAFEGD